MGEEGNPSREVSNSTFVCSHGQQRVTCGHLWLRRNEHFQTLIHGTDRRSLLIGSCVCLSMSIECPSVFRVLVVP